MTRKLDNGRWSAGDRARGRAYLREFLPGVLGYLVVLLAVLARGGLDGDSGWRFVWAVLPVLPMLWVLRAVVRNLGRIDEYPRLLLLRGLAGGFAVAMVAAMTLGFLGIAGFDPPQGLASWSIFALGMAGWVVASAVASRS